MHWITEQSVIKCDHDGRITNLPSQHWVTITGVPVLVDDDPQSRSIVACPNYGPTIKPCSSTLQVAVGYSPWIKIDGKGITLSTLDGFTDGTPPGLVHYRVRDPQQVFVESDV